MLCKNCNYILSGKENFCPNCAAPLKEEIPSPRRTEPEVEKEAQDNKEEIITDKEMIFKKDEPYTASRERNMHIFYDMDEKDDFEVQEKKSKSHTGRIFLLLFVFCAVAVAAFSVADYLGITSSVFSFIQTVASGDGHENVEDFSHSSGVLAPDINYSPSPAYIMSGNGLSLRKGPGNSYAPLKELSELTAVQILGGSIANKNWVYVYSPEKESYGWLDSSFLAMETEPESETTLFAENAAVSASEQELTDTEATDTETTTENN